MNLKNFTLLFLNLFVVSIFCRVSLAQDIILATDDTPGVPYIMGEGTNFNWDKPGIEIEIYKLMEKKLNLKIKFFRYPWERCLNYVKAGKVDGIFPTSFKPERKEIGVYPTKKNGEIDTNRKTRDTAYYLYKNKNSNVEWNGKDFINLNGSIGAPIGWAVVSDLKNKGVNVTEIVLSSESLNMVLKNRLAGIACLSTVLDFYIEQEPLKYKDIVKVYPALSEKPYYLMFSHQFFHKNPELAEQIWDTIAEIQNSEEFKKVVNKYKVD
ncbi:MAG: transporter substrate-binding domain-containing protein [Desulfobacterales bacterium]|nr:transporter substrate-binding domain-containing protein [Desulfobacterales bacterium]